MDITAQKADLRHKLRAALRELSPEEIAARSRNVTEQLIQLPEFIRAECLAVFISMASEVDTTAIALNAWQTGKRVCAPRVSPDSERLVLVEINSLTHDLAASELGVREPIGGPPVLVTEVDFVLVPGLGFDRRGNRLGRGRAYYDRFLSQPDFRGCSCAVGFELQLRDYIPTEAADRRVDLLVTEARVYRFDTGPDATAR